MDRDEKETQRNIMRNCEVLEKLYKAIYNR